MKDIMVRFGTIFIQLLVQIKYISSSSRLFKDIPSFSILQIFLKTLSIHVNTNRDNMLTEYVMGIQHKAGLFPIFRFIIPYYLLQVMF